MEKLGVIGGSGLYEMDELEDRREVTVETPFGMPSDDLVCGRLRGTDVVFLPRHGRGHRLLPTEIPFRANIYALKTLGVDAVLAISAVGSMREEIAPGDLVVVDQFIDRTRHRQDTFFGEGIVAHVHFADPVCEVLAGLVAEAAKETGAKVHVGGTYLCMEGPQFSTRAESLMYRSFGVAVIGMTNLQEAKLAREAGMSYATLALATDYDCWHETEADVSVDAVLAVLKRNVETARAVVRNLAERIPGSPPTPFAGVLENAILTPPELVPLETKRRLAAILPERYRP